MGAHLPRRRPATAPSPRRGGDVLFFLSLVLFLSVALGSVIVAQKVTISYLSHEFPRVAEHNYRALQVNFAALEGRLNQQLRELSRACVLQRADGLLPPPAGGFGASVPELR